MSSLFSGSSISNFYRLARPSYSPSVLDIVFDSWTQLLHQKKATNDSAFLRVPADSVALDVGCGSGQFTRLLAGRFAKVVASDTSESQIAAAKLNLRDCANVELQVGDCLSLKCQNAGADLVAVAQALHWFDVEKFYAEAARCLRPCGALAVLTYAFCTVRCDAAQSQVDRLLTEYFTGVAGIGPYWDERRALVNSAYATVPNFNSKATQRRSIDMSASMPLSVFVSYLKSQSAYETYCRIKQPAPEEDVIQVLLSRLLPLLSLSKDSDPPMQIVWPLTVIVSLRPSE